MKSLETKSVLKLVDLITSAMQMILKSKDVTNC
jgi:hypothetical protein